MSRCAKAVTADQSLIHKQILEVWIIINVPVIRIIITIICIIYKNNSFLIFFFFFSQIDDETARVLNLYVASYKHYAKINAQFKCISDMNKQLNSCHLLLNKTLDSVQMLNNKLPPNERLEPFVWTTG